MQKDQGVKALGLIERTTEFGIKLISLCKRLPKDHISTSLISQCVRAGTSIGANYMEASNASSRKDFRNKVYISKKETQGTKYWLKLLSSYYVEFKLEIDTLWQEAHELNLILQSIANKLAEKP